MDKSISQEDMAGATDETLVCVKQVKQEVVEEWDESMPLPGDIIEGLSEYDADDDDPTFVPVKTISEFSYQLGKMNSRVDSIFIKVRRGDSSLKLHTRIVQQKGYILRRKYTIQAATDHRHVAELADLTLQQCTELQGTHSCLLFMLSNYQQFNILKRLYFFRILQK